MASRCALFWALSRLQDSRRTTRGGNEAAAARACKMVRRLHEKHSQHDAGESRPTGWVESFYSMLPHPIPAHAASYELLLRLHRCFGLQQITQRSRPPVPKARGPRRKSPALRSPATATHKSEESHPTRQSRTLGGSPQKIRENKALAFGLQDDEDTQNSRPSLVEALPRPRQCALAGGMRKGSPRHARRPPPFHPT